jgi:hypothetical protein
LGSPDVVLVHPQNRLNGLILNWCIGGCWFTPAHFHNFPTDFISSQQWVKASENTNMHTMFLLQIRKQREDSAMLLTSNKQHHKEIQKTEKQNRIDKTHRKGQQGRTKTK